LQITNRQRENAAGFLMAGKFQASAPRPSRLGRLCRGWGSSCLQLVLSGDPLRSRASIGVRVLSQTRRRNPAPL